MRLSLNSMFTTGLSAARVGSLPRRLTTMVDARLDPVALSAPGAAKIEVAQVPCLDDNYGFLVHDPATGLTASVDTPEVAPLAAELEEVGGWGGGGG